MTPQQASDIRLFEETCQLAARTLDHVQKHLKAGMSTNEINQLVHDFILSHGAIPAPLNYHGFPKSVCTSPNSIICHGVPDETKIKDGDILNVDVTVQKHGFFGDTSRTFFIGPVSEGAQKLTEVAREAMMKGIEEVKPGTTVGDIGFAIEKFVTRKGYHVVRELGGHGIGRAFHEEPFVPSFGKRGKGAKLQAWKAITVEPMINETASPIVEISIPGSTIMVYETGDQSLSAQFEHTVLITDTGHQILTLS
jgi:methionyl aminopeptidase